MALRRHTYYDIGSYISEDNNCSAYLTFKEETVELVKKYFGNSNYFVDENDETSQETFREGKIISCYHQFMKGLQLLDSLHVIWLMIDDVSIEFICVFFKYWLIVHALFQFEYDIQHFFTKIFRPSDSPFKQRINELIKDPSKRGRVDWWIPFLLMKWFVDWHNIANII